MFLGASRWPPQNVIRYVPMVRRVAMWIAVFSLAALGSVSATSAAIYLARGGDTGWIFYTPYSVSTSPSPSDTITGFCGVAQRLLLPIAAFSSGVYIYLAERAAQRLHSPRGFEVQMGEQSGGT